MAKREHQAAAEDCSVVEISAGMIKGYHEFKIKLPIGCNVIVEREASGAKDEYALLCKVPSDLDDAMMEMVMKSKSAKTEYKVRDLVGKTIGCVQYFLNKTFVELLDEGRVTCIQGCITGEPTASVNPQQKQKWVKNRRTGGGAIIPCTWLLWVPQGMEERVMEVIRARLPDVDGHEYMDVQVRHQSKKKRDA